MNHQGMMRFHIAILMFRPFERVSRRKAVCFIEPRERVFLMLGVFQRSGLIRNLFGARLLLRIEARVPMR